MKRSIVIGIALVLILSVLLGAYVVIHRMAAPAGQQPSGQNPFASTTGQGTGSVGDLQVMLTDGTKTSIPDFTKQNQPPIAGPDTGYQVAGSVDGAYQTLYFPQDSYFLISLLGEPLGQNRIAAENALRDKLGLSDEQLCKLNVEVRTTSGVNDTYAGKDLGLSFCPGATKLP